ncbi:MAG: aminotransferase class V-fold PLP-dependent enzyme [Planctomycetota bacterium]
MNPFASWVDLLGEALQPRRAEERATPPRRRESRRAADLARVLERAAGASVDDLLGAAIEFVRVEDVPVAHPRHFGPFLPEPSPAAVLARGVSAALGSQLAVRAFAPAASALEEAAAGDLLARLGRPEGVGFFTGGASESLHTALLVALTRGLDDFAERGLDGRRPVVYRSAAAHLATDKAARACGLGRTGRHVVPTTGDERLDPEALRAALAADRESGRVPVAVVATFGTTVSGAIDPLDEIGAICAEEGLFLVLDAAWGGAVAFSAVARDLLAGSEHADAIAIDLHKWPGAPPGLGFLALGKDDGLEEIFGGDLAGYLPGRGAGRHDPRSRGLPWSRPLRGLEYLALAAEARASGEDLGARVDRMIALGRALRTRLGEAGWRLRGRSPLPVVCFDDPAATRTPREFAREVWRDGAVWIGDARYEDEEVLRAAIVNRRTGPEDLDALVATLDRLRSR